MEYNIQHIETAFFNYSSNGSEESVEEWIKLKDEWRKFSEQLEKLAREEEIRNENRD